jgi:hypothetical protein
MRRLFTADRLFDGERALRGGAVLIDGDKIEAAGPAQVVGRPAGVAVYEFGDVTVDVSLLRYPEKMRAVLLDGEFAVGKVGSTDG